MELNLVVTNSVGGLSTLFNGLFIIVSFMIPPDNLGLFRSQYYVGVFASFFFAAMQFWTVNMWCVDDTLFTFFSARGTGQIVFLTFAASANLQFTMLSSNFAVRYAAVRGGWMRDYLTNHIVFYGLQFCYVLGGYIPPIILLSPTPELRATAHATCGDKFDFDFMNDFYFAASYEHLIMGNIYIHRLVFFTIVAFQGTNLLIMLGAGLITFVYISANTQSKKVQEGIFTFIFLFMPGMLVYNAMILRIDSSIITPFLSAMLPFATMCNPVFDLIMTPGYRKKYVLQFYQVSWKCNRMK
ncbi:hypothetical protein PMAYCL1PPCAC_17235, partial [Pristionchus mayeri]